MQFNKSRLVCGFVWIIKLPVISAIMMPPPSVYRRTVCSMEDALDYLVGQTLWTCKERCERMSQCKAINYHIYSKLCVVQETGETETSDRSRCVSLEINNKNSNIDGPCSIRPCGNLTLCKPFNYGPGYSCVPMFCSPPLRLQHASLMTDTPTPVGGSNVYRCDQGYTGFLNPRLQCLRNGEWTPVDFACYRNCPAIPAVATADLMSWSPHRLFENTRAILKCKAGFYNLTAPIIVCDNNGTWSHFKCLPYCLHRDLPVLIHGSALPGDKYTTNMRAEYSCKEGYYLSSGSLFLNCGEDGAWSNLEVVCLKYCIAPGQPTDGTITALPTEPYVHESVVSFTCNSGYYHYPADNKPEMVCQTDGAWNYLAECYKHCGDPPPAIWDVNGQTLVSISTPSPYTVETVVQYNCIQLRFLSGSKKDKSTCDAKGNWDGPDYCCFLLFVYNPSLGTCTFAGL